MTRKAVAFVALAALSLVVVTRLARTAPPDAPATKPADSGHQPTLNTGPAPLPAAEAAKHMTLPDGFTATLFAAEPDVVQPIAMTFDDRGRLWVAECLSYPEWNKSAQPDTKGKDRITVFEDTDGDGHFDKRTVFADDLANLSGFELGFGGVYVCQMPYFKFIPADFNADEPKPTGPAQVLLDGWDVKGAGHNVFGNLAWGPDGWLWGLSGIQSKNVVGKPGAKDDERVKFDCGVWRYHPTRKSFEVVCWGTTNPFGLDFDEYGQAFFTNCVIKHLWHAIPGAHFQRMYGDDPNKNIYQPMESCADHIHWAGGDWGSSRGGLGKHGEAGGGHAHVGCMIYQGENWPADYRNGVFMCNLHGNRVNHDVFERKGSGYIAHHGKDFLFANDSWFRGTCIKQGPDGSAYVADWTDTGECHNYKVVDRTNGRIYKVTYGKPKPPAEKLAQGDMDLVNALRQPNAWVSRHARRRLQERAAGPGGSRGIAAEANFVLSGVLTDSDPRSRLEGLWALNSTGQLDVAQDLLRDPEPYVRGWAIRLAVDDAPPADRTLDKLAELARSDPSPVVRLHLASALQRLPADKRWDIAAALLQHNEDWNDPNLPLMYWYAVEPLPAADEARSLDLLAKCKLGLVRGYLARRAAGDGSAAKLEPIVALLGRVDAEVQRDVLRGINQALAGQRRVAMPAGWPEAYAKVTQSAPGDVREAAAALALTFGDQTALAGLRKTAADASAPADARASAVRSLVAAKAPDLVPLLQGLLDDPALRGPAARALASADDPKTADLLLERYAKFTPAERQDAIGTLASRPKYVLALLAAVESGKVPRTDLTPATVRQLAGSDNKEVKDRLTKVWGAIRPPEKDKAAAIARYKQQFGPEALKAADLSHGRAVFDRTCAQCHTLFDAGGKVGPNLTGSQRANLDYLLENVVDPSALVAKEFQMTVVDTKDGRNINGIVVGETDQSVTIRTTTEDVTVPKDEVAKRKVSSSSMMPEGLLDALKPDEQRDLVGYLASPQQVAK